MPLVAELFDCLARMSLTQRRPLHAAQLFGWAATLTHERSERLPDAIIAQLRAATPAATLRRTDENAWLEPYTAAWRDGELMGLDEAFACALEGRHSDVAEADVTEADDAEAAEMGHVTAQRAKARASMVTAATAISGAPARAPLHVDALGRAIVRHADDGPVGVTWRYAKALELLYFLVDAPQRTRGQICLALWPDAPEERASALMRAALYHLRKALGDPAWIVRTTTGYQFNRALPYRYDVELFEATIAQAQARGALDAPGRPHAAEAPHHQEDEEAIIGLLAQACAWYQGDYLADLPLQEWIVQRQTELRRCAIAAQLRLGAAYERQDAMQQAFACYQRVTDCDPYNEQAHMAILRCYVQLGQRSQAIRYYHDLRAYLRDELGIKPDPQITSFVRTVLTQAIAHS
jgi:DNA-binding SARP family transcriptional activator